MLVAVSIYGIHAFVDRVGLASHTQMVLGYFLEVALSRILLMAVNEAAY